jgi:hypothetical protein
MLPPWTVSGPAANDPDIARGLLPTLSLLAAKRHTAAPMKPEELLNRA